MLPGLPLHSTQGQAPGEAQCHAVRNTRSEIGRQASSSSSDTDPWRGEQLQLAHGLIKRGAQFRQQDFVAWRLSVGGEEQHFVEELLAHHPAEELVVDECGLAQQPRRERVRHRHLFRRCAVADKRAQLPHQPHPLRHREACAAARLVPLAREPALGVADGLRKQREERLLLRLRDGHDEPGTAREQLLHLGLRLHHLRVELDEELAVFEEAALVGVLRRGLFRLPLLRRLRLLVRSLLLRLLLRLCLAAFLGVGVRRFAALLSRRFLFLVLAALAVLNAVGVFCAFAIFLALPLLGLARLACGRAAALRRREHLVDAVLQVCERHCRRHRRFCTPHGRLAHLRQHLRRERPGHIRDGCRGVRAHQRQRLAHILACR
mmetsp:Transcript_24855/g.62935  ORF Transcript_24855/g.62935 Transcript_24855/m.62935 type:complete len:377 (-) Transcript_24855:426-1556(-)